jgi:hypothetical protein
MTTKLYYWGLQTYETSILPLLPDFYSATLGMGLFVFLALSFATWELCAAGL